MTRPQIVILGGGFGGIRVARQLAQQLPAGTADVILVDREAHHLYTPSLYEIVGGVSPREVCIPIEAALAGTGVRFVQALVEAVSIRTSAVSLTGGEILPFHQLVFALGATTNYAGIRGLERYAFPFKSVQDAWLLRQQIERQFRDAADDRRSVAAPKLNFLVAGAGPTGIELAGELAQFSRRLAVRFGVPSSWFRVELVEAGPTIAGRFAPRLQQLVAARLRALGVTIATNQPVQEEQVRRVIFRDQVEATETLIWTAGVMPHPLAGAIRGLTLDRRGHIMVDGQLRAVGADHIWVVGDAAATIDAGTAYATLAQADVVAHNLAARLTESSALVSYHIQPQQVILPIGHGYAVMQVGDWVWAGWLVSLVRRLVDFKYLLSIVPLWQALKIWLVRHQACPDCRVRLRDVMWVDGHIS